MKTTTIPLLQRPLVSFTLEEKKQAHIDLERRQETIIRKLGEIIRLRESLQRGAMELTIAERSPAVKNKLQSFLKIFYSKKTAKSITDSLQNVSMKMLQDPPKIEDMLKKLFRGTPFSPARFDLFCITESYQRGCMKEQIQRDRRLYQLQGNLRHRAKKVFLSSKAQTPALAGSALGAPAPR